MLRASRMCTANAIRTGLVGSTAREAAGSARGGPGLETSAPRPVRSAGGPRGSDRAPATNPCVNATNEKSTIQLGIRCITHRPVVYTVETPRIEFTGT